MPISENPSADALSSLRSLSLLPKGNLYIRFDVLFPKKLSTKHKQALIDTLRANAEENNL
jgi:DnaJ-class molecular chaperone